MADDVRIHLEILADRLMTDLRDNSSRKTAQYQASGQAIYQEFYPSLSKPLIDEIDRVLAQHYNFTEEELDFTIITISNTAWPERDDVIKSEGESGLNWLRRYPWVQTNQILAVSS